jgi:hypothetical protein
MATDMMTAKSLNGGAGTHWNAIHDTVVLSITKEIPRFACNDQERVPMRARGPLDISTSIEPKPLYASLVTLT